MRLDVPDEIVRRAQANAIDLHVALAVQLYSDNRLELADACRLSQISQAEFNRELLLRGISLQQYPARVVRPAG